MRGLETFLAFGVAVVVIAGLARRRKNVPQAEDPLHNFRK